MMPAPFIAPHVRALLDQLGVQPAASATPVAQQRAALDGALAAIGWPDEGPPPEAATLRSGALLYVFEPDDTRHRASALPVIAYAHGGSFVAGGIVGHAGACRMLANVSQCAVALVDYRLAPEHPAPAAVDDVVEGVQRLLQGEDFPRLDRTRIAVFGDSAGGALAAASLLRMSRVLPSIRLLAMVNPMISPAAQTASLRDYAVGYFATSADFNDGWSRFRAEPTAPLPEYLDLATAQGLDRLPPLYLWTNEADPVRDEAEAFAERVAEAGGTVVQARWRGVIHASWLLGQALPEAQGLITCVGGAIGAALHSAHTRIA